MSLAEIAVPRPSYVQPQTELPVVLVVEDERKLRWALIEQFEEIGLEVLTAKSGYEAIRIAGEKRPGLILLDGLLPEMHGFEIARFIRRIDAEYRPHIAIMTAIYKHLRYQNEARLKYGIDDYLIKPVLPQALRDLVQRAQVGA